MRNHDAENTNLSARAGSVTPTRRDDVSRRHDRFGHSTPRAFTIIELLVVIAILALLLSILLPTLGRAKQSGQMQVCTNNLRNLIISSHGYCNDNKDVMPDPAWDPPMPKGYGAWLYSGKLADAVKNNLGASTGTLWPYLGGDKNEANATIQKSYRCPVHKPPFKNATSSDNISSYMMNGAVRGFGKVKAAYRIDRFRPDAWIFWETDEAKTGWNDGSSYPDEGLCQRHGSNRGWVAKLDNTGATIAVADGSCRWVSRVLYEEELKKKPGRLWCNPGAQNGT